MKIKQIITTSLGNTLEWLDFGMFIYFTPIIGEKFFHSQDKVTNTLAVVSVFAAGFICRPLGGIIFGHAGDVHGRASTLRLSILLITLCTLLIGCLPTYEQIGIASPVIFILLRLIQGISVGGEYSGVMIYLAESAPSDRRGFITSFAAIGANVGFLLASLSLVLMNYFFTKQSLSDWGWRLPFLLIGAFGTLIFYLRFHLIETSVFTLLKKQHHLERLPLLTALHYAPKQLLKILGLTCLGASLYYVFFGYMPTYMNLYLNVEKNTALFLQSFFLTVMLILVPLAGFCGDKIGRKRMLICVAIATVLLAIPIFFLLYSKSLFIIFIAFAMATTLSSIEQGNTLCAVVENCPANVRYSGIALSYNLGNAVFGGTAPIIITLLTEKIGLIAPAFYLLIMAGLTFIAACTLLAKADINQYL